MTTPAPRTVHTLYTDPVHGTCITAERDASGWWILRAAGVFLTPELAEQLHEVFTEHAPSVVASGIREAAAGPQCVTGATG